LLEGVKADQLAPPTLPAEIKGGVAHDPQQPGLERAAPLKAMQMGECLDKSILDGIQRVRLAAEEAKATRKAIDR